MLAFLSTFWHPCSKYILIWFEKDRGGCQVWKCPKVPELDQRSTECKFLYIRQILALLSISYPKILFKVMQNLFWIIQPCYNNKKHHQGMMGFLDQRPFKCKTGGNCSNILFILGQI